jgi:L-fuculose-phosphate aldolase
MENQIRQQICKVGKKIYSKNFVASTEGNVSVKMSDNRFLITPTDISKGELKEESLSLIDINGNLLSGEKRSSEYKMHLEIYKKRKDVNAIIHAHPVYSTAFAVAGMDMEQYVLPEVVATIGLIPLVKYETPSSQALAELVSETAVNFDAMLLENHGLVVCGYDLWKTYYKLERVEHTFKIIYCAKMLGKVQNISDENVKEIFNIFNTPDYIKTQRMK